MSAAKRFGAMSLGLVMGFLVINGLVFATVAVAQVL